MFDLFSRMLVQVHQSAFLLYQAASTHIIFNLALIVLLGVGAQWVAWLFHIPSILLLLLVGFIAGPGIGLVNPDLLLESPDSPGVPLCRRHSF